MTDEPITSRPVNSSEKVLRDKFAENIAGQSEQMDRLAQQLITLELAIPGLYATVLKLLQGDKATLSLNGWLYFTFGCWLLALLLALASLIPRRWQVDPTILKQDPAGGQTTLSLEQFFQKSAQHKRRLLIPSILLFWAGILSAALLIL